MDSYSQFDKKVFFYNIEDMDSAICNKWQDTSSICIYWEFDKIILDNHTKQELDSLLSLYGFIDDSVDIYYWDYSCIQYSTTNYESRSYFLYDYIKSKKKTRNMYVYHRMVDCESLLEENDRKTHRILILLKV